MIFWILLIIISITGSALLFWPFGKRAAIPMLILPAVALLLYQQWGAYSEVQHASVMQQRLVEVKQQIAQDGSKKALIKQFEDHLKKEPNSAKGWYLLGKLYLSEGQQSKAVEALTKSNTLNENDLETMLALAEAKFITNNQKLDEQAKTLLKNVIAKEPNAVNAYNLLAIDAFNTGDYKSAVAYWEKVLPFYPPDSAEGKKILDLIARAQAA